MIFIDTGAWLGLFDKSDQFHEEAQRIRDQIRIGSLPLSTSNLVLSESLTLLARRIGYRNAAEVGRNILAMNRLQILRPDAEMERLALVLLDKWSDQRVSYCDCLSFTVMRLYNIRRVFTFDRHFELAGFQRLRA
jgi:predicted nucleic acid-binding protein